MELQELYINQQQLVEELSEKLEITQVLYNLIIIQHS